MRIRDASPGMSRHLSIAAISGLLLTSLAGCALQRSPHIQARAAWDHSPPVPYAGRVQQIRRIVIHHDAVDYRPEQTGEDKVRALLRSVRRDGWPDLPYHYLIDRDGRIFAGRPEQFAGYTNNRHTGYDPGDTLHIALLGNYNRLTPTAAQLESLITLVRAKANQYAVPDSAIKLHAELAATACPGRNLRAALAARPWSRGGPAQRDARDHRTGSEP